MVTEKRTDAAVKNAQPDGKKSSDGGGMTLLECWFSTAFELIRKR